MNPVGKKPMDILCRYSCEASQKDRGTVVAQPAGAMP